MKYMILNCSINRRGKPIGQRPISTVKTVSKQKFQFLSEDKIRELQQIQLKKRSLAKCKWAGNTYNDWRDQRLLTFNYDYGIYNADLCDLEKLEKDNLQYLLCRFIPKVTKSRGDGPHPAKTLYQMVVAIQKYLWVNKINWQLVEGKDFGELKVVLDNVMQERTRANVGVTTHRVQVITYEFEEKMWHDGILGEDTPDKLKHTVLFLLGINVMLRAIDEQLLLAM